jgi:hypothetical protein
MSLCRVASLPVCQKGCQRGSIVQSVVTANCIIIAPKRLKLRLSGSARKSQQRFRDTPRFKFRAVLTHRQPFLSGSARKRATNSNSNAAKWSIGLSERGIVIVLSDVTFHSASRMSTPVHFQKASRRHQFQTDEPSLSWQNLRVLHLHNRNCMYV